MQEELGRVAPNTVERLRVTVDAQVENVVEAYAFQEEGGNRERFRVIRDLLSLELKLLQLDSFKIGGVNGPRA
jgi:hypothetical protein